MRPNQQNKNRSRGRNNGGRKHSNPLSRNYESNGPDVKIRGNASHIAEKYLQLARDATASGDLVMAENYLQHAEHYFRIISAAQPQPVQRSDMNDNDDQDDTDSAETADNSAAETAPAQSSKKPEPAEAAPAEAEEEAPVRRRRTKTSTRSKKTASGEGDVASQDAGAEEKPAAEEAASDAEPEKPKRRPRRRRQTEEVEATADAGELPAFLTNGQTNAAE